MTVVDVNDFSQEKECIYKEEHYSVRDNGAVLRHHRKGKNSRAIDDQWTFGKENSANPYLHIASVRIHRIVATAFHGEPSDPKYVVDHIDTNCRNNRPENLRWLTRLENALKNPATRKKIEYLCGSIDAFLENPSMLNEIQANPNIKWMRTVTIEEAKNCKARMDHWATIESKPIKSDSSSTGKNIFAANVYKPFKKWEVGLDGEPGLEMAKTTWCAQYMYRADAYFPCCPDKFESDPLAEYFQNIQPEKVLSYTDYPDICPKFTIVDSVIVSVNATILVIAESGASEWVIVGIQLDARSNHFIHFILGLYSSIGEVEEAFRAKKEIKNSWSDGYSAFGYWA
jgi:hypothetical protein